MAKEKNSSLMEIRDLLKEEMDKFKAINEEISDNQSDFEKISNNYTKSNKLMDKAKSHINDLKNQEYWENIFIKFGQIFFMACVLYVISKRIPLHKIILLLFKMLYKIVKLLFSKNDESISSIGDNFNKTSLANNSDL